AGVDAVHRALVHRGVERPRQPHELRRVRAATPFRVLASSGRTADEAGPPRGPGDRLARFAGAGRERRAGDALLRAARPPGAGGGELMDHAIRNPPDGTLACRPDGEKKAIIAQVAHETADLTRTNLGGESEHE